MTDARAEEMWMPLRSSPGTSLGDMMEALTRFLALFDGDQPVDPSTDGYDDDQIRAHAELEDAVRGALGLTPGVEGVIGGRSSRKQRVVLKAWRAYARGGWWGHLTMIAVDLMSVAGERQWRAVHDAPASMN
jgi:hypothetical protein